jgi:N-acyl-L-homoserine lactone synthetase
MTTLAIGNCNQLTTGVMALMHQFRHDVFVKRLGWSLPLVNGVERDQYDTDAAQYVVVTDELNRVTGCARLLPTTETYMLPELFPQLLGGNAAPCDEAVWELSRFATSVRETREGRVLSLSQPTLDLLAQVLEFAAERRVKRLLLVTSIGIERLMLRAGVGAHRMGPPALVDGNLCVALFIEVPARATTQGHCGYPIQVLEACA